MGGSRGPYNLEIVESCSSCSMHQRVGFCNLQQGTLTELNSYRQSSLYPRGAVLFVEGQVSRGLFILCSGQAKLGASSESGHVINLRLVEHGELLGLSSVILNEPYVMKAETLCPSQVSFIPRMQILQLVRAHSDFALNVARHLGMELHKAYDLTRLLALAPGVQVKIAQFLVSRAERNGASLAEGVRLAINMTHEEIGESIGASRETVSRTLSNFKHRRLISVRGGSITILQPQQLRHLTAIGSSRIPEPLTPKQH